MLQLPRDQGSSLRGSSRMHGYVVINYGKVRVSGNLEKHARRRFGLPSIPCIIVSFCLYIRLNPVKAFIPNRNIQFNFLFGQFSTFLVRSFIIFILKSVSNRITKSQNQVDDKYVCDFYKAVSLHLVHVRE